MKRVPLRVWIWAPIAALAILIVAPLLGPLASGWACYRLNAGGEHVEAHVVGKDPQVGLILQIHGGTRAGSHCTSKTTEAHRAIAEPGDVLAVVLSEGRTGECVLVSTLESSAALLLGLSSSLVVTLLLLVLVGLFLQRSFTQPVSATTLFDLPGGGMACPRCDAPMSEGYLPLVAGIHWRAPGEPVGLPHVLGGLPGTRATWRRPRLHAFRCVKCEIGAFQYGEVRR